MESNKETNDIIMNQKKLNALCQTDEWKNARAIFIDEMSKLLDIGSLGEYETPEKLAIDVHGRKLASQTLFEILRRVEGEAQTYETTKDFSPTQHPYIIMSEE